MGRIQFAVSSLLVLVGTTSYAQSDRKPAFAELFSDYCSVCHGDDLRGAGEGTPLVGIDLLHGDTIEELVKSINDGYPEAGMRGWAARLTASQIRTLAIFISEERAATPFTDFRLASPLEITKEILTSEHHDFRLEVVIDDLEPLPFSIAPLPDGRILVTEKLKGLSIVTADGVQSELLKGAPEGYGDAVRRGPLSQGTGWILDVALHPEFDKNGWIYLSYGDRCTDCNETSRASGRPVSMTKIVRGRLRDGSWVDEETIWKADLAQYTSMTDMVAGGRMTFDDSGHLFFSIGMKGLEYSGIQDLSFPYGKIHRVHADGRVPDDNPFLATRGAVESTWTFGHRSPQGLEYNLETGELWGTEMGPRGGDEVNLLQPARNYGWPVVSKGVHYDGRPVSGEGLDIDFDPDEIEQPVVDLTPSVAVSSFVFYRGDAFPEWQGQMLVGSLKAADLYRFVFEDGELVHRETLIEDLARFRDIEVGPEGEIYLLLEHDSGSRIVRVTPGDRSTTEPTAAPDA